MLKDTDLGLTKIVRIKYNYLYLYLRGKLTNSSTQDITKTFNMPYKKFT